MSEDPAGGLSRAQYLRRAGTTGFPTTPEWPEDEADLRLYVSPSGDDDADGRSPEPGDSGTGPFRSLERARDTIRERKRAEGLPEGGASVSLRGGEYRLTDPFELTADDGGTESAPVVYRAYGDESVRLTGGTALPTDAFESVSGQARDRIPADARDEVVQLDLGAQGIDDYGEIPHRGKPSDIPDRPPAPELFVDGERMELARYPSEGFVTVRDVDSAPAPRRGEDPDAAPTRFAYGDERPESWASVDDVWLWGYWKHDWATGTLEVYDLDPEDKRITAGPYSHYGVAPAPEDDRRIGNYYYFNVLEELDRPGEFYIDREAGMLYLYPPTDLDAATVELSLSDAPLVTVEGASDLTLRGLTLELTRADGVEVRDSERTVLYGCTLRRLGGKGVVVTDSRNSGAIGCDIAGTGKGGVVLNGGDRETLSAAENFAVNDEISRFSCVESSYSPAVSVGGVGNRVAHNEIHGTPHQGMSFAGNDHLIEYNYIHDVVTEASDMGAIYAGRSWVGRGTVVRYNYIRDVASGQGGSGQMGVYLDDLQSGVTVHSNVIHNADRAFMIGGGRDNTITNNLVLDCDKAIQFDARGAPGNWRDYSCDEDSTLMQGLRDAPYRSDRWQSRYPELVGILDDDPCLPKHNVVASNVFHANEEPNVDSLVSEHGDVDRNVVTRTAVDPVRTVSNKLGFEVDSAVSRTVRDWKAIPFDDVGLRTDEEIAIRRDVEADAAAAALDRSLSE